MSPIPDLLSRRASRFVLWRPAHTDPPPRLVAGRFADGELHDLTRLPLAPDPEHPELWSIGASDCGLADGAVVHYWFLLRDSRPGGAGAPVHVTDPLAGTVDWRVRAPGGDDQRAPAAVVMVRDGRLVPCDPDGGVADWSQDAPLAGLRPNNRTVLYELPVQWTRVADEHGVEVAAGTFRDVLALVERDAASPNFPGVPALAAGRSYLSELGVTTLQLLPIADSVLVRGWKYGTSNYLAPDHTLGLPQGAQAPTPISDLARLVSACHRHGMRFFLDAVMGFGREDPYRNANFMDFHVRWRDDPADPERDPEQGDRNGWGGDLWKFNYRASGYDPVGGKRTGLHPARGLMLLFIARWLLDQRIDGVRVDSVNTIHNWDFVGEFSRYARSLFQARAAGQGVTAQDADARFLVVGEELALPGGLLRQRIDALWNEEFKYALRAAVLGQVRDGDPGFEHTVRKMIDCRLIADFTDGAEAVNYVTSHDVGNWRSERLYDYLTAPWRGVGDVERRIKLAFSCLLTAVGIPMIFAGEEFADRHDQPINPGKETDPVNYSRLEDPWRRRVFDHVARLVRLRHESTALAINDVEFIHVDLTPGRRVLAWRRGHLDDPVIVVANFSGWQTDDPAAPASEYVIPRWPAAPPGSRWREVTQDREVPAEWAGREPIYAWEAKVYALA